MTQTKIRNDIDSESAVSDLSEHYDEDNMVTNCIARRNLKKSHPYTFSKIDSFTVMLILYNIWSGLCTISPLTINLIM